MFISLILTICLFIILRRIDGIIAGNSGLGVVHLQFAFIKEYFVPVIASWGTMGIDIFLQTIWLDFVFPLCYATLLSSFYAFVTVKNNSSRQMLIKKRDVINFTIPFIAAIFDYIENAFHIFILSRRWYFDSLVAAGSIAALIKWSLLAYIVCAIFIKYLSEMRHSPSNE